MSRELCSGEEHSFSVNDHRTQKILDWAMKIIMPAGTKQIFFEKIK